MDTIILYNKLAALDDEGASNITRPKIKSSAKWLSNKLVASYLNKSTKKPKTIVYACH